MRHTVHPQQHRQPASQSEVESGNAICSDGQEITPLMETEIELSYLQNPIWSLLKPVHSTHYIS
jgi:hypothetical protein